jgi:hypothetical protein
VILSVALHFALALVCLDCGVYLVGRSDHILVGLAGESTSMAASALGSE